MSQQNTEIMDSEKRIEMVIEYAKKVLQYPKGSKGYDAIDEINLRSAIEKYEQSKETIEPLKDGFYKIVAATLKKEMEISNIGVQKEFQKFVLHLESIMTHSRIINQFRLACEKWEKETGIASMGKYNAIRNWINEQPKNY